LFLFSMAIGCASAYGQASRKGNAPAVVLDTLSVWRIHETLKPPLIRLDDGLKPVTSTYEWLDRETGAGARGRRRARPTSPASACGRGSR
jgi:hypothetical protein